MLGSRTTLTSLMMACQTRPGIENRPKPVPGVTAWVPHQPFAREEFPAQGHTFLLDVRISAWIAAWADADQKRENSKRAASPENSCRVSSPSVKSIRPDCIDYPHPTHGGSRRN